MIQSEILKEKDRIQAKLAKESASINEYFMRSQLAAKAIAETYGFRLRYAEMSGKVQPQKDGDPAAENTPAEP
jgi:hypothetical protein